MNIFCCLEIITSCACHRLNATAVHHHIILTYLCCYVGKFFFIYCRRRRSLARSLCHIIIFYDCNSNGVLNSNRPKHTVEPIQTKIKHICHIGNAAKIVDFSTSVRKYWFCICFHHNQHIFLVKLCTCLCHWLTTIHVEFRWVQWKMIFGSDIIFGTDMVVKTSFSSLWILALPTLSNNRML